MIKVTIIPESIKCIKLTDKEYFSDTYKEYISNSKLGLINPAEGGSIEKFETGFKEGYSDSYELGSAVHSVLLQPDEYEISNLKKPNGKLGVFVTEVFNFRNKGYTINDSMNLASEKADYYKGKLTETRIKSAIKSGLDFYSKRIKVEKSVKEVLYLSEGIYSKWSNCMTGVYNNPKFVSLLNPDGLIQDPEKYNEYAIFCEIIVEIDGEEYRIKIKAKLDNFTIDHESATVTLNDVKTTGKYVSTFMGSKVKEMDDNGNERYVFHEGSFDKYCYYRQMALYLWLLQAWLKKEYNINYQTKVNMLVVETIPNFKSKVYPVNGSQIKKGLNEFKELIALVALWKYKK